MKPITIIVMVVLFVACPPIGFLIALTEMHRLSKEKRDREEELERKQTESGYFPNGETIEPPRAGSSPIRLETPESPEQFAQRFIDQAAYDPEAKRLAKELGFFPK